jgi:UrcA family protein
MTMNRFVFAIATAALSTAAVFAAPQAFASDMKLSWGDLDLSTPAGQKVLDQRIGRITATMCADQITTGTLINPVAQCRSDLKQKLAAQVAKTNNRIALSN